MSTTNETLIQIIAAGLRARDSLPEGDWKIHTNASDGVQEIYVAGQYNEVADFVAACSTHELDDYLMIVRPQVAVDLARDLLQMRGVAGSLLDALAAAAADSDGTDGESDGRIAALCATLRQMVAPPHARVSPPIILPCLMPEPR